VYILKSILHDWPDERCVAILRHCRAALKNHGRLVLVERVMPERTMDEPDTIRVDLQMLAVTGGRERSEGEYGELLRAGGWRLARIAATRLPFHVIEGLPL
jgi:hypothetical protein